MMTWRVDDSARRVIQVPKLEPRIMCYELANLEWSAIKPFLPNKPRGVPRVNGQRECDWVISYLCRQWLPFGKVEKVGFQFLPLRH
jgi:hypothetical protein